MASTLAALKASDSSALTTGTVANAEKGLKDGYSSVGGFTPLQTISVPTVTFKETCQSDADVILAKTKFDDVVTEGNAVLAVSELLASPQWTTSQNSCAGFWAGNAEVCTVVNCANEPDLQALTNSLIAQKTTLNQQVDATILADLTALRSDAAFDQTITTIDANFVTQARAIVNPAASSSSVVVSPQAPPTIAAQCQGASFTTQTNNFVSEAGAVASLETVKAFLATKSLSGAQ